MKLKELVKDLDIECGGLGDTEITGVTSDTRSTPKEGFAFVCIKGGSFDGHSAAADMVKARRGGGILRARLRAGSADNS